MWKIYVSYVVKTMFLCGKKPNHRFHTSSICP